MRLNLLVKFTEGVGPDLIVEADDIVLSYNSEQDPSHDSTYMLYKSPSNEELNIYDRDPDITPYPVHKVMAALNLSTLKEIVCLQDIFQSDQSDFHEDIEEESSEDEDRFDGEDEEDPAERTYLNDHQGSF